MRIGWRLAQYVEEHDLGAVYAAETGFILARNPDTVRAPDVAFVSRERLRAAAAAPGYWPGPPDLAVEVVSPSDTFSEMEGKLDSAQFSATPPLIAQDAGSEEAPSAVG